jgi:hypothetical protein
MVDRGWFDKGSHDCGDHEWYRADEEVERCYHCVVGVRPYPPEHFA